ncbi:LysR family transcriptional regulator [Grimontia celer]|nr:LysR family transcriptional regulator [Grimontia celer]
MTKPDFNLLSVFLTVYELRSITAAAESLNMTQPGVSTALKRLKKQIGVELFVREGRGISPTHAAVQLANDIRPALEQMSLALSHVNRFTPQTERTFNVLANEVALQLLHAKVEQSPLFEKCRIQFNPVPRTESRLLEMLSMQKADLAIDVGKVNGQAFQTQPLFDETLRLICAKNHPRIGEQISKTQYYAEKHITLRIRRSNLFAADYFTKENLSERIISAECESISSMMALVGGSECVGMTSHLLAEKYAKLHNLKVLQPPFTSENIVHQLIWHKRNQHSPANLWLRNALCELIKDSAV